MVPALLIQINTPYQGPGWSVTRWVDEARFPEGLRTLITDWGTPDDEANIQLATRAAGQGHVGPSIRGRVVLAGVPPEDAPRVQIFRYGEPLSARGQELFCPRRCFLVRVGVVLPEVARDGFNRMFGHDVARRLELNATDFLDVMANVWLPNAPDMFEFLIKTMIEYSHATSEAARRCSNVCNLYRKGLGKGPQGGTNNPFFALVKKYLATHDALFEGYTLHCQRAFFRKRAAQPDASGGASASDSGPSRRWENSEVTQWKPGSGTQGWKHIHETDPCHHDPKFAEWFETACKETSGFQTLSYMELRSDQTPATLQQFVDSWRHSLKCSAMASVIAGNHVEDNRMLRAFIPENALNEAWVIGSGADLNLSKAPRAATSDPDLGTFRDHACLIMPLGVLRATDPLVETLWRDSFLRILASAPQTAAGRWRLKFHRPCPIHGDVVIIILNYVGWALDAYSCMRRGLQEHEGLLGSAVRLWYEHDVEPTRSGNIVERPTKNFWLGKLTEERLVELQRMGARKFSDQQREVYLQVGRSNAPIHLVTAVAGAGKSTLVQAMLGSWPAEEGLLLWLTATRELRDDVLLNSLLLPGATLLQTDELLWGGRPSPAALRTAPEDRLLDMDIVETRVREHMADPLAGLERMRAVLSQRVADLQKGVAYSRPGPGVPSRCAGGATLPLGFAECLGLASEILLKAFRDIFLAYPEHLEAVLSKVKVLVCTTGLATQLLGKRRKTPLTQVLTVRKLKAAVVDEIQNQTAMDLTALAAQVPSMIILGDPLQHLLHLYRLCGGSSVRTDDLEDEHSDEASHQVFQKLLGKAGSVTPVSALQIAKNTVEQYNLSETWRCSPPLTDFIYHLYWRALPPGGFRPAKENTHTDITFLFYQSIGHTSWYTRRDCLHTQGPRDTYWDDVVCWHDLLFRTLSVEILTDLLDWCVSAKHDPAPLEPIVLVIFFLKRTKAIFELYFCGIFAAFEEWVAAGALPRNLKRAGQLRLSNVSFMLAAGATGPNASRVHVVHHRRTGSRFDQLSGVQGDEKLRYVAYTRATDALRVWWETVLPETEQHMMARRFNATSPSGDANNFADLLANYGWWFYSCLGGHADTDYNAEQSASHCIKRQRTYAGQIVRAKLRHEFECLQKAVRPWNSGRVRYAIKAQDDSGHLWCHLADLPRLVKTVECAMNRADSMWGTEEAQRQLHSLRPAAQSLLQILESIPAADITTAYNQHVRNAANPSNPLRQDWGSASDLRRLDCADYADWRHVATHWGASIVNAISCTLTGKRTADVSVPWLTSDNVNTLPRPAYATGDDGDYVLHSLVAAVWFIWGALRRLWDKPEAANIYMHSRHHKGKHQEHDGLHLWVKACNAEREAVCLVRVALPLPEARVVREEHDGRICLRPGTTLGEPLLYVYYGMGVSEQPEEVGGLLFKARDVQVTIAVLVTMQLLSLVGSGEGGLPVNVLEHDVLYQVGFETRLPRGVVWATVCCALGAMGLSTNLRNRGCPEREHCARMASAFLNDGQVLKSDEDVMWWVTQGGDLQEHLAQCLLKGNDVDEAVVIRLNVLVAQVSERLTQSTPPPPGGLHLALVGDDEDDDKNDKYGQDVDWGDDD